jgi:hypothetical protein
MHFAVLTSPFFIFAESVTFRDSVLECPLKRDNCFEWVFCSWLIPDLATPIPHGSQTNFILWGQISHLLLTFHGDEGRATRLVDLRI